MGRCTKPEGKLLLPLSQPNDAYDRLPYTDHAYAESHPDRLAVVARLSGWRAPDPARARVLELGCGRGGNLLPMAAGLPQATLVGVDRSARQIAEARRIAEATGLRNVQFFEANLETFEPAPASFDYVVAHGVASWVPPTTRRALFASCTRALAPGGLGYVSFNVLPGWYERMAARDWLRFATSAAGLGEAPERARASLVWLSENASAELGAYRRRLELVADRLQQTDRAYLAHEYLAAEHHPQLVSDLLAEAAAAGLLYLGDAIPATTALELLPSVVSERARTLEASAAQQLIDFAQCTAFRRALFVRDDAGQRLSWRWPAFLDVRALETMRVASRLRPRATSTSNEGTETFDAADVSVQVIDPVVRRSLHELAGVRPRSLAFDALAQRSRSSDPAALASGLLELWLATGTLDFHLDEPTFANRSEKHMTACALARWHAANGGTLTNRWHHEVRLEDPVLRFVLARLDGHRSVADLASDLASAFPEARTTHEERVSVVEACIDRLFEAALLVA